MQRNESYDLSGGEAGGVSFVSRIARADKLALRRDEQGQLFVTVIAGRYEQGTTWAISESGYAVIFDEKKTTAIPGEQEPA